MNLFTSEDKLKKYDSVEEIIEDYYEIRLNYYEDRKEYMVDVLERELLILANKAKYIQELLDGTIDLRKKKKQEIVALLVEKDYDSIDDDNEYKYLVKMPMDSVSEENVEKLLNEHQTKKEELDRVKATSIQTMWLNELEGLEQEYMLYKAERAQLQNGDNNKKMLSKKKVVKKTQLQLQPQLQIENVEELDNKTEEIIIEPKKKKVIKK
jgi:DNA topoisomerase-2